MNVTHLIGNVGSDPLITNPNEELKIASISLATNEYIGKGEDKKTIVEWHNLKAFNQLATVFELHVKKGDKIRVTGKNQTKSWVKDEITHYRTEIVVSEIEFLTPKSE